METIRPKTVIAPKGCKSRLTENKEYEVIGFWSSWNEEYGYGLIIKDDNNNEISCLEKKCAHLNRGNWIIKEYENE